MTPTTLEALSRATINGVSLAVAEHGQGEPVVLVHGSASDIRTWDKQVSALSQAHRVISYSRRYARPNIDIPEEVDDPMMPHVEDLIALIHSLGVEPAHLVGHSWGAFICLLAAIHHPEFVRSLALIEPPVLTLFTSPQPRPSELLKLLVSRPRTGFSIIRFGAGAIAPAKSAFLRGDTRAAVDAFGRGVLGATAYASLSEERRAQVLANVAADRAQLLGAGFPPLEDDEVRAVQAPTLLLHGEHSPPIFACLIDRLEELLPRVERAEVSNATHIAHEDNPEAVNRLLLDFFGRSRSLGNA